MTRYEPTLSFVLRRIASICGNPKSAQSSLNHLLSGIDGFVGVMVGPSPTALYVDEIEPQKQWLNLDAKASVNGFSDVEWGLVVSAAAGVMQRIYQSQFYRQKDEESLASIIIVKDREGRFLQVNQPLADLYGTTCEEMIGKTDADFNTDSELSERYLKDDQKAITSGEPVHILNEETTRFADGSLTRFETVKVPLKNSRGEFDRVLVIATPQSDQPMNNFASGFQNSFLFQMIDNSPNWIAVKDRNGNFIYVNEAFCGVVGMSKAEILNKTDADLFENSPAVKAFQKDDFEVINSRQEKFILEEKVINSKGEALWVQTVKKPVIEADGSCDKVLIVCVPIDEQRKSANKIKENRQFLREVIDSTPNLILVKDREGKILLANQAVADLYGVDQSNLIGKKDADFTSDLEAIERFRNVDKAVFESGQTVHIDAEQVVDSKGFQHWFKTTKKLIQSKRDVDELLIVCTNITAEVKANENLKKAKEQAVRASYAKTEFLSRMSHELRTPLNAILGFNQLLQQDDNLTQDQVETLGIVNKSGKHLLNLISDVLEMSKVEMGELTLSVTKVNLPKLIKSSVDLFTARAAASDCQLTYRIEPDVPNCIKGDEVKLRQVILNFISNAVKFTHDGAVEVHLEKVADSRLKVSVIDDGPGIAEEEIDQVFGLFRQTESGRKSEEGAGLGLSISKSLIELMGGEIGVQSELGQGSTFYFEIPVKEMSLPLTETTTISVSNTPNRKEACGFKVLVVDDAEVNRQFLTRLLNRLGYKTLEAVNGLEAVQSHLDHRPDLILMDVKMPEMDGMTATSEIRKNEVQNQFQHTPIIAVTANAFEEHRHQATEVGCDGFIAKPFEFADLVEAISEQVSKKFSV